MPEVEMRVDHHSKLIRIMAESKMFVPAYLGYLLEYRKIPKYEVYKLKFNDVSFKNLAAFKEAYYNDKQSRN